ncbi:hypothetical protein ACOWZD_000942 [Pseudomonas aeruginosa]|nr:hypothetical protein [Pseudomonas aeruginosa]
MTEEEHDAKLRAEAQALREEVAEYEALCNRQAELLSQSIVAIRGPEPELTRWGYADLPLRVKTIVEEVAALRARVVVVPERLTNGDSISRMLREIGCDGDVSYHHAREIWNACLDELARINGLTVSEALLRRLCEPLLSHADYVVARNELRALLSEQDGGNDVSNHQ